MPEYALLRLDMPGYGYASDICPDMFKYAENMCEYAQIYLNGIFVFPYCNPLSN